MSPMVTRAEGVTVFTITSSTKSKRSLICHLLGTLCISPVCFVSRSMKQQLDSINTVLGALQILFGLMTVGVECMYTGLRSFNLLFSDTFWFGTVLIAAGIFCNLVNRFTSPCMVSFLIPVNLVSVTLVLTTVGLLPVYLVTMNYNCNLHEYEMLQDCEHYMLVMKVVFGGLIVLMILLSIPIVFVTVSSVVLSLMALCKKKKGYKMILQEEPELSKLPVGEDLSSPAWNSVQFCREASTARLKTFGHRIRMSLTMTKSDGVTVFTVTSNPKSKWPLICQLLATLCYSPVCSVSQSLKQKMGRTHTALGTLQILVGLMNVGFGCIYRSLGYYYSPLWDGCFWLGAVFIAAGIVCILAEKFPSSCLLSFSVLVNLVSAALAITATVLYSVDLARLPGLSNCNRRGYSYGYEYGYYSTTPSPDKKTLIENCERNQYIVKMVYGGLEILMIVLAVLQLCVTISSCALILKTLCKKKKGGEMEDPELHKPLVEEVLSNPTC
ncbi:hypothetical protein AOLI_G00254750 [Acnodon oligacanthus]